jgi:guanine deaminase
MTRPARRAVRGRLVWFEDDPHDAGEAALRHLEDGVLFIEGGRIARVGEATSLLPHLPPGTILDDHRPHLVMPGFIDTHIHYPQGGVVASYGTQLLDWLERYTFPAELAFADPIHARHEAAFFLDELLRNGTTTAAVYCTVHPQSVDAFFAEAQARRLRMIAGKMLMDRGAPQGLLDTPERGHAESLELIDRWHGVDRLGYAVTPRFALTSSEAQLEAAGDLLRRRPDLRLQTHLAENCAEIAAVAALFPAAESYTSVYDRSGLLGPGSLLGHCIHLCEAERQLLHDRGSVACFCPTSNLFIGSGLFDLAAMRDESRPIRVGLATDIGGGTSYSMLRTAAEAYKILQLQGLSWHPFEALYAMTLGNARALGLERSIGRLATGMEADLVVLDPAATPAMAHRLARARGLDEILFLLVTMGDEQSVRATYVLGEPVSSMAALAGC